LASVRLDDLPGDEQPQTEAAVVPGRYRSLEPAENSADVLGGDSDPRVDDAQAGDALALGDADDDRFARPVFESVREHIGEHLVNFKRSQCPRPGVDAASIVKRQPALRAGASKRSAASATSSPRSTSSR